MSKHVLFNTIALPIRRIGSQIGQRIPKRFFGLRAKITFLILLNVTGVLFLSSFLDFHLAKKEQIGLFLDRDLYIAKQIEVAMPVGVVNNLTPIRAEVEEWLLSRPSLMEIDVFLFSGKGWNPIISTSKGDIPGAALVLSDNQIRRLKKDRNLSSIHEKGDEQWLEVVVPLHIGEEISGGVRVVSFLDEAPDYLTKRGNQAFFLTFSSILIILITITLLFGKLVGTPIQKLVKAMSRAEKGDLEAKTHLQSRDELGELGRHFNRMLKTIREAHEQNVQLLSRVNQFNEELTRRIEDATSELARRNEELRVLNEALFESQRQLSQSEKLAALGQVTATMAHQIGTPLNSISGYIQLILQEGNLQPADRDRLEIIESQLDRLEDSVKNLLSFTRQPKPQLKAVDTNSILVDLIYLGEPWFHTRGVELSSSLAPDLPLVLGDPTYLQTLFLNLITNALDAMPNGGLLTIKTQEAFPPSSSENGRWMKISITDTGIGITEESKKRIFDPFYTTKKIGEGGGLGLAICEKIVKEHFGRLEV
ncbi:MAG: ATP-binding protein, partial [Desulfobacterales bacterium]|nr:ATP-binding protein [Desulfobacterales bacterium]